MIPATARRSRTFVGASRPRVRPGRAAPAGGLAPLVLGAWVLLQPPVADDGVVLPGAPLGQWVVAGRFADGPACEAQRRAHLAALAYAEDTSGEGGPGATVITASRCIALERLKELLGAKPS